ncbi:prepilin-type N-terminal cleavage/methylation domain-containing protein [Caldicellulosiruptor acetigenus]|uniref:prepilin-type N-terminal cleavage/methylation domain-containing protein n=1 Tax=Caldicellulosiruptor acetigenus TaxID=301953 RepID=UPI0003FB1286|nr:prepilin-type N-terminal cleavage/methylation domain-containing protein [Caldicellulosiruptor acetigenus]WAM37054.1 prepilin-type N-terminal cleavage/methylation domain-containing protein [Caldicellulosiruptor acetigenus]
MRKFLKGFTLIEIIAVVAIVGIIIVALYSFFMNNFKVAQEEAKIASIESQAKRLQDTIKQWLQMADQQSIVGNSSTERVDMIVYEDNSSTSGTSVTIKYEPSTKGIRITKDGVITPYLEGKVTNFDVDDNPPQIVIQYTVDLGVRGQTRTYKIVYNRRYDW